MADMFTHEARHFKFQILTEVAENVFHAPLDEDRIQKNIRNLVSLGGERFRCCVYKEREVLRQRVRLALGKNANEEHEFNPKQIIHVIDAACDGCYIKKIRVTDNCRRCMSKACLSACRFGAISMGPYRSQIDYAKCKECGACAKACPYNAIVITERPCYASCPVGAVGWDAAGIAYIDEKKCTNCGQCENACPFGAMADISWIVPVIEHLKEGRPMLAVVAPSIQGQFKNTTLPQILTAVEKLGFKKCYEVAAGADAVAENEYLELKEHKEEGKPMTTSCCPGFVNMLRIHYPKLYQENKSTTVTPMEAIARKLKNEYPDHEVVFIGPCLAKKQECMDEASAVDYVLTYEEIAAMFRAKGVIPAHMKPAEYSQPSRYGRGFAASGGVSAAVAQAAAEHGDGGYTVYLADGADECRKQLTLMEAGKFNFDILEGMCCKGGCIGGPACVGDMNVVKGRMIKENLKAEKKTIRESLEQFPFDDVDMVVADKKNG